MQAALAYWQSKTVGNFYPIVPVVRQMAWVVGDDGRRVAIVPDTRGHNVQRNTEIRD